MLPLLTRRGDTLGYDRDRGVVWMLDRRRYPHETVMVECTTVEQVAQAIRDMVVQGGPPLAYVAGYGLALAMRPIATWSSDIQRRTLDRAATLLRQTRPTADDLHHLLDSMLQHANHALFHCTPTEPLLVNVVDEQVARGDAVAEACGRTAATLLRDGDHILTHCFAGAALNWMLYVAHSEQHKTIYLYPTETRPYLQGARLTAHQAHQIGVHVTLLTDGMPGFCFSRGMFNHYITAADRIAMDGSIANKIGTYQYAVLAARHKVPFSVLGYDGPDPETSTGDDIPIEERNPDEVLHYQGIRTAPSGVTAYYPAFDVTPPELITRIVTDRGIFTPSKISFYYDE